MMVYALRDWLLNMDDHAIVWWTFIVTVLGVTAGLVALYLTWLAVRDTKIQSEKNAETTQASFILQIREGFGSHVEAHINLRRGGSWYGSETEPSTTADYAKIELYMGLFEFCDELLEKDFLNLETFSRQYLYRIENLLTNYFVTNGKLTLNRSYWLGFINLCYRMKARNIPPAVTRLSNVELENLYPAHRRRRLTLVP